MARQWASAADDGAHFRLALDKPGTWSQKDTLGWDRLLGLNLFPRAVAQNEVRACCKVPNGAPSDTRRRRKQ